MTSKFLRLRGLGHVYALHTLVWVGSHVSYQRMATQMNQRSKYRCDEHKEMKILHDPPCTPDAHVPLLQSSASQCLHVHLDWPSARADKAFTYNFSRVALIEPTHTGCNAQTMCSWLQTSIKGAKLGASLPVAEHCPEMQSPS